MKKLLLIISFLISFIFHANAQLQAFTIDELLKASDELFTNKGQSADTGLYILGERLFELEQYDSASIAFSACVIKNPLYLEAYFNRGVSLRLLEKLDPALKDFEMVVKLQPKTEDAYYNMGLIYLAKKDFLNAIKSYDKAIAINNRIAGYFFNRVIAKSNLDYSEDDLLNEYDAMLNLKSFEDFQDSQKAFIYNNKAYILVGKGILDESLKLVNRALNLDKSKSYIWDTRGEIYYKMKKYPDCIVDMDKAIQLDETSENSFYYRGLAKIKINQNGCLDLKKSLSLGKKEAQLEIKKYCN